MSYAPLLRSTSNCSFETRPLEPMTGLINPTRLPALLSRGAVTLSVAILSRASRQTVEGQAPVEYI